MARALVGLDIGTHAVHVSELTQKRNGWTVRNFGGLALPQGVVRDGEILDGDAVAETVRQLMAATHIRSRDVVVGLANQRVIVREVTLPTMSMKDLRASIAFQVQEYLPIAVEDARLDVHVMEEFTDAEGNALMRLLLVAAENTVVDAIVDVVQKAKLRPVKLDLNAFAVLRAAEGAHRLADTSNEVVVDIGAGVTNLVVHARGEPSFVRVLVMGGDDVTRSLARELDLSFEEAERLKRVTGLQPFGEGGDAAAIIRDGVDAFIREVRGSLDYFHARRASNPIDRVVLSGGGSLLDGLHARLSDVLRVPVESVDMFDRLEPEDNDLSPAQLAQVEPVLATSVGLALGAAA